MHRPSIACRLFLTAAAALAALAPSVVSAVDTSHLANPVLSTADNLRDPSVFKVRDGYLIFYSRLSGKWGKRDSWTIASVFTPDFKNFRSDRDISPKGYASPGDVVFWHGRYILPYQDYPGLHNKLVFSTSSDLENWSAPAPFLEDANSLPWNEYKRAIDPTFVVNGDTLHCFFIGSAGIPQPNGKKLRANLLGHAVTKDPELKKWDILTRDAPILGSSKEAPDGVENIMVFRTGDHWTMIFSEGLADQHLALATSANLHDWKTTGPLDIPRQTWMKRKYGAPFVWKEGDSWMMLLMGENARGKTTFGLLKSPDGKSWTPLMEKQPPVLQSHPS